MALVVKNLAANAGDTGEVGLIPNLRRSTREGNGNSSILAWRVRWTEKPGRLYTVHGIQRVGHDLATKPPPPDFGATSHRQA